MTTIIRHVNVRMLIRKERKLERKQQLASISDDVRNLKDPLPIYDR